MTESKVAAGSSAHDVLRLLYENGAMRQREIAASLHITPAACNLHFKKLLDDGLIIAGESLSSPRGRPSQLWSIRPDGNCFMGVLLADHQALISLIDFDGKEFYQSRLPLAGATHDREALLVLLHGMVEAAQRILRQRGYQLWQSFIGLSGIIAPDGTMLNNAFIPALNGVNLEQEFASRLGTRCYCDTMHYGDIQSQTRNLPVDSTVLLLDWCEGCGGVVTCNRQTLMWADLPASRNRGLWNIGHVPIVKDGRPCYCGQRGCLEAYVGGAALLQAHPELGCRDFDGLLELLEAGDSAATMAVCEAAGLFADSLYWLIELFGVDHVMIQGAMARYFDRFEAAFRAGLELRRNAGAAAQIHLTACNNSQEERRLGTALMARHFFFYPDVPRRSRGAYRPSHPELYSTRNHP